MKNLSFKPFTWSKFTAIFLVVLVLLSLFSLKNSSVSWAAEYLKEAKADLAEAKADLAEVEQEYKKAEEAYNKVYEENGDTVEKLKSQWDEAEAALDKECSRDYYSYYSCRYNGCSSLHTAAENAKDAYEDFVEDLNIEELKSDRDDLKEQVEWATEDVKEAEEDKENAQKNFTTAIFSLTGYVLRSLALLGFAFFLFTEREYKLIGFISLGVIALGNIITLFIANVAFPLNPYFWDTIVFGIFALVMWKEKAFARKGLVALRVTAIVLAFIEALLGIAFMIITSPLTLIALILISFVLVPINFKEYTKVSLHIFLSIITCGIWILVWFYHVTKNLNKVESMEDRNPVNELLLCAFLPFYGIYWMLKNAEYIEAYAKENGKQFSISILCFLVAFVSPLLSTVFMQDKINEIVGKPE